MAESDDDLEGADRDLVKSRDQLRRMVDALESVAVFDRIHGEQFRVDVEQACAFVAGEALSLLWESRQSESSLEDGQDLLFTAKNYLAIESALLYMIGGYDINAITVINRVNTMQSEELGDALFFERQTNAKFALTRIVELCSGQVRRPHLAVESNEPPDDRRRPGDLHALHDNILARMYLRTGRAVESFLDWLGGYSAVGPDEAVAELNRVREACIPEEYPGYAAFAGVYHLVSLLLALFERVVPRSLIHTLPRPTTRELSFRAQFERYVLERARGLEHGQGRPFLWPSSEEYATKCLPGPQKDAVVAMPTGSGKSFVAELAIAHALAQGWVLYLAPTNALVHQIRRDLIVSLKSFSPEVTVRAFVGEEEYTLLTEDQITISDDRFVAVMTPEKCALALRLYPDRFEGCALCVFDECHLLSEKHRGITADIVMSQLISCAPTIRFVLMSAMISNADDLAEWLRTVRSSEVEPIKVKWRPSRTMRGLLVLDGSDVDEKFSQAKTALAKMPAHRVNNQFGARLALIAGLSGPWTMDGPSDYRVTTVGIDLPAKASRRSRYPIYPSWKNTASRLLAEKFGKSGLPVLCFILSSRHHAFSLADKVSGDTPNCLSDDGDFEALVEAWLVLSDAELGLETILRDLLRRGIAVHTSSMLQTERAASEWMFSRRRAEIMFATGTLAQGLNLPAIAVVISGTSMGDVREARRDAALGTSRVKSVILNAFGRAGRPGFSNQGIAILVSDDPFSAPVVENLDPSIALSEYSVMGESDATTEIRSPVERFIDEMLASEGDITELSEDELVLISLLAEYDTEDENAGRILSRTLAGYHKRDDFDTETRQQLTRQVASLKRLFLGQSNVPDWMNTAAMRAGVNFFRAWKMWNAYQHRGLIDREDGLTFDVGDWFDVFIEVMAQMPPYRISPYLPDETLKRKTVLTRMRDAVEDLANIDDVPWESPDGWCDLWSELGALVQRFMGGESYIEIADAYLDDGVDEPSPKRSDGSSPLPIVFGFVQGIIEKLAIDAGCFLALYEGWLSILPPRERGVPESLQALPLCIRNGCDSLPTLTWFRFGYRNRVAAHGLQSAFEVPVSLTSDKERSTWVRQARHAWLTGEISTAPDPVLDAARTVILQGAAD
jgi:hypothetical protein